ncbi:LysM domain containing protein [Klebsormidium nitens]|uniref:LysM domain containing protein n=1 Tax=Klebsormidium nitens TaxID=105231 RepID=A0A1Y1ICT3_KLENI|nr:LysM domain containing protein [Klebsormidium nitens]|eukprot:GAQ88720.1 LysM domain containing protein [Klebsormidium nitens]
MASAAAGQSPAEKKGAKADANNNEMIAKAAGVVIAAGIGLTLLKAGRKKKVNNEVVIDTPDIDDSKSQAADLASEAEHKTKGFFGRVEKKVNHAGSRAEDGAKQGQRDAKANADKASHELKKVGHEVKESADNAAKKTGGFFSRKSHEAADQVKSATPTLKTHTIRQGDTLWGLSRAYGVAVEDIKKDNFLASSNLVPGQTLSIRVRK